MSIKRGGENGGRIWRGGWDDSFYSITCIKGSGTLMLGEAMPINSGETVFIPATDAIMSVEGNVSLVITKM